MMDGRSLPSSAPQHDLEVLQRLMVLPEKPVEASFEQVPRGTGGALGPSDYLLVAVLRFVPDAMKALLGQAQERTVGSSRISARAARNWFPAEVKAAMGEPEGQSGAISVKGRKFDATLFARAPLLQGYFIQVTDTPFVIVVMQTD
jgi:hypothetical protein